MTATTKRRRPVCEASGLWAPANADGRATCPLCESTWHVRNKDGTIRAHVRAWPRPMTLDEVYERLQGLKGARP